MREMGASDDVVQQHLSRFKPDDTFEVLEENWPTVEWFLEVANMLIWVGDYCARLDVMSIKADAELSERKFSAEQYSKLKIMFAEYCSAINSKLAKRK